MGSPRKNIGARLCFSAFAAVSLFTVTASAQVNAEGLRPNVVKPGFAINLDTAMSLARGNIETFDFTASGRIQYQTLYPVEAAPAGGPAPVPYLKQRVFIAGSGRYSDVAGTPVVSQTFLHMRWSAMWIPKLGSDLFVQQQADRFFRLQRRMLVGAGARVDIVHLPVFLWWGGSAYMLEYERINVKPGASDAPETLSHRWTNYLTERLAITDALLLQSTTYYQPRFDDFTDFRILEVLEGMAKATDMLGFGLSLSVLHDSAPPTGVKNTDLRLTTNIHLAL